MAHVQQQRKAEGTVPVGYVGRKPRWLQRGDHVLVGDTVLEVQRLVIGSNVTHVGFAGVGDTFELPSHSTVWVAAKASS